MRLSNALYDAVTSVIPRNTTSGPLPIPRLRCTLNADGGNKTNAIQSTKKNSSRRGGLFLVDRNHRVPNPNCLPHLGCTQYNFPRSYLSERTNSIGERAY